MNCLVDEIKIDVSIVWRKDHWPYPDMFWTEGLVLRFCRQISDKRCLSDTSIFKRSGKSAWWKLPEVASDKRNHPKIPSECKWVNVPDLNFYEKVRMVSSRREEVDDDTFVDTHGSFLDDGGSGNFGATWDTLYETEVVEYDSQMRVLRSPMHSGSITKDTKPNEENDWVKWMVKADCGTPRRNPAHKNASLARSGLTLNRLREEHDLMVTERLKFIDLCTRFLRDVHLIDKFGEVMSDEWKLEVGNDLKKLTEDLTASANLLFY